MLEQTEVDDVLGTPERPPPQTWAGVLADRLETVLVAAAGGALIFIGFLIVAQVFFRYVLAAPPSWTEELTRYVFVWLSWLGAAVVFRWGQHITIDAIVNYIPQALKPVHEAAIRLICAGILLFLLVYGIDALEFTTSKSAALGIDMRFVYASAPVAAGIMLLFMLLDLVENILSRSRTNAQ
jgi:TRAP-type C4-dicarboxylate transport system permease small subunit